VLWLPPTEHPSTAGTASRIGRRTMVGTAPCTGGRTMVGTAPCTGHRTMVGALSWTPHAVGRGPPEAHALGGS
jgi:hypothetical protein